MSFWNGRNVFITGCTGFLGYWLTRRLVEKGAVVTGLVRDIVPRAPFFSEGMDNRINVVAGDVRDIDTISRCLGEYDIDCVFHLAAQSLVSVALRDPMATLESNIRGTWNVLEATRRASTVTRVIVASSDKAYGSNPVLPYTEDMPLRGTHPYDCSKSCTDLVSIMYHHTYDLPVATTRCGNLFGPGDTNFSRIIPGTIRSVLMGENPVIRSDGTLVRDYIHMDDAINGYLLLAEKLEDRSTQGLGYNFGTGEPLSVMELTRILLEHCERPELEPVVLNQASTEIQEQYLSSDRARSLLGWQPESSVSERLLEVVDWYREYVRDGKNSR